MTEGAAVGSAWTNEVGMEFLWVPPGEFLMGGADEKAWVDEVPVHPVRIDEGLWLGKYPVTQGEWTAVMGVNPSRFQGGPDAGRRPVEHVSWVDCHDFLARLGEVDGGAYRLPSEAEWEYACRAGTTEPRYGPLAEVAWFEGNAEGSTRPVGGRLANPWGFHDMLGNVWEWVEDRWHDTYEGAPPDGGAWVSGGTEQRVLRGGCWYGDASFAGAASRNGDDPTSLSRGFGFRVVAGRGPSAGEGPRCLRDGSFGRDGAGS